MTVELELLEIYQKDSILSWSFIERILDSKQDEILERLHNQHPSGFIKSYWLHNGVNQISINVELKDGITLSLEPLYLSNLLKQFPDCGRK